MSSYLWLIPVLPLIGFLINGLARPPKVAAALVGCAGPIASFALAVFAVQAAPVEQNVFSWITVSGENLHLPFGLRVDELSGVMILVVTGIGSLIHIYSIGYMHEDPGFSRFFAYLNLFMFSMLVLVMGDSIALMFVGWEGVGLCSYLLIGFWYKDLANADAGKKAFVTNRVGDFGFLLGIFVLWQIYGTLDFKGMAGSHREADERVATAAALLLFVGACGKSAQIPLYVWLPDAMAGPTPVSALIHAATMVTAGVYMVARMHFLYVLAPGALHVVAAVGAATALLAGVIAVAQNDIKKVLAYSTISQLGFMFAGLASLDFTAGIFHVVTHAFFKALLFLGAGAVIHALHGQQDIRKMGGLAKKLPLLALVFGAGALALAGLPFSAGFVSKDQILTAAFSHDKTAYVLLALTALVTAFYTTRLFVVVFLGKSGESHATAPGDAHATAPGDAHATAPGDAHAAAPGDAHAAAPGDAHAAAHEVHKPGPLMMGPLVVLALLSLGGGVGLDEMLHHWLGRLWSSGAAVDENLKLLTSGSLEQRTRAREELIRIGEEAERKLPKSPQGELKTHVTLIKTAIAEHEKAHRLNMWVSSALFLLGAGSALVVYTRARAWLARLVEGPLKGVHRLVSRKFFVDEIYEYLVVAPLMTGATVAWFVIDRVLIDTVLVNGSARLVYAIGGVVRRPHTGSINMGVISFVAGAVAILAYLAVRYQAWKIIPF